MKLILTLLARDEADIIDAHLAYHYAAGVDFVVATDHRSHDGTTEVLERYASEGRLHVIRRGDEHIRQSAWMTEMARLAATQFGADWIINSDADEFWWPQEGSLKDSLGAVPQPYGIVYAVSRVFVPRPGDAPFFERMTARLTVSAPINDTATPYRHVAKVAHRADAHAVVRQGNHRVTGLPYDDLRAWSPVELLHFPLRSRAQSAGKHERTWTAWRVNLRGDIARSRAGGPESFYDLVLVDDEALARGLADGTLIEDTRLRDALRAISEGRDVSFPRSYPQDASRLLESVLLLEADGVRLQRRADDLAARIAVYGSARQ